MKSKQPQDPKGLNELKELLLKTAKENPMLLSDALRKAGNFCYLIVPNDVLNYDDYQYEGKLNLTKAEVIKGITEFDAVFSDELPYGEICQSIAECILKKRGETWDKYDN